MRKLLAGILLFSATVAGAASHDITSLSPWGPYSKEYFGISHIDKLDSGIQVEFCLVPGQYRRNYKVPCTLFESGVHPWNVTPDMRHITYRHDIEWKDRVYVDATYHLLDDHRVLLEARCVNNTSLLQNLNLQLAVHKSGGKEGEWMPELNQEEGFFTVRYPGVESVYGVVWDYPWSEVRTWNCARLEELMPRMVHKHTRKVMNGDYKGHYTANFLRPVTLQPQSDTTIFQLILCGSEDFVRDAIARGIPACPREEAPAQAQQPLGVRLLQATLLTNVSYPVDEFGEPVRHFGPGKNWDSFYTWDCGFIAWGMGEIAPQRGYEIIRQYTTSPEEKAPFMHHGTPLAIQIFAVGDVWKNCGYDEAQLREIYPRLKRFYDYMTGPDIRLPSGLLATWKLFYSSGGWDDYPPQHALRSAQELRSRTAPMVSTSYYIRCAKILRLLATHLGEKKDLKQYDADIAAMGKGILDNAWDGEAGYFGYVEHDTEGRPVGLYRTPEGVNFNRGLDGVTPLVAGIVTPAQQDIVLRHLFNGNELWSPCGITAVDQHAPYYRKDGYWNSTVWMPHQLILWKTMLDLGMPERARQIAETALENWERECADSYNCYEHFMIETGRGGGWHNFSGLSCPILNWYNAYHRPGTVSTGFGTLVTRSEWKDDYASVDLTLEFDKDYIGREVSVLVCLKDGVRERKVKATRKPLSITVD